MSKQREGESPTKERAQVQQGMRPAQSTRLTHGLKTRATQKLAASPGERDGAESNARPSRSRRRRGSGRNCRAFSRHHTLALIVKSSRRRSAFLIRSTDTRGVTAWTFRNRCAPGMTLRTSRLLALLAGLVLVRAATLSAAEP